jgi:hypothetical protein
MFQTVHSQRERRTRPSKDTAEDGFVTDGDS